MDFDPRFWHKRFTQQAGWTMEVRRYILQNLRVNARTTLLEVGCGTGAILHPIYREGAHHVFGADISFAGLQFAHQRNPHLRLLCANGFQLPLRDHRFHIALCHYFLLWVADPLAVLLEMKRVTRPGGYLVVLAEPDYAQREDQPPVLQKLGELQNMALLSMGARLDVGSHLQALFQQLDLQDVHVSMLKPAPTKQRDRKADSLEWQVIAYDLQHLVSQGHLTPQQVARYHQLDAEARADGSRLLHIPTYFGWARVP